MIFTDNQLTTCHTFIGWSQILCLPLHFYKASHLPPPHRMDAPDRHNGRTDASLSVRSPLRWSLTLTKEHTTQSYYSSWDDSRCPQNQKMQLRRAKEDCAYVRRPSSLPTPTWNAHEATDRQRALSVALHVHETALQPLLPSLVRMGSSLNCSTPSVLSRRIVPADVLRVT